MSNVIRPGYTSRCISAEVRSRLAAERLSGLKFAPTVGMSQNYLATRLRDEKPFTVDDIEQMCIHWDVDPGEFVSKALRDQGEVATTSIAVDERISDDVAAELGIPKMARNVLINSLSRARARREFEGHEPPMDAAAHSTGVESAKERMMREQDEDAERQ